MVVTLFQANARTSGWTEQDKADFYRAADALRSQGLDVEFAAGTAEDGEPWAAFCHPETGDVLVHFALIDGQPIAYDAATDRIEEGGTLRALIDRFLLTPPDDTTGHTDDGAPWATVAHPGAPEVAIHYARIDNDLVAYDAAGRPVADEVGAGLPAHHRAKVAVSAEPIGHRPDDGLVTHASVAVSALVMTDREPSAPALPSGPSSPVEAPPLERIGNELEQAQPLAAEPGAITDYAALLPRDDPWQDALAALESGVSTGIGPGLFYGGLFHGGLFHGGLSFVGGGPPGEALARAKALIPDDDAQPGRPPASADDDALWTPDARDGHEATGLGAALPTDGDRAGAADAVPAQAKAAPGFLAGEQGDGTTVTGTAGRDIIDVGTGGGTVAAGGGHDVIVAGAASADAGHERHSLRGEEETFAISGGSGNDVVTMASLEDLERFVHDILRDAPEAAPVIAHLLKILHSGQPGAAALLDTIRLVGVSDHHDGAGFSAQTF